MKTIKPAPLGTVSHATLRSEDLLEAFGKELEWQIQRNGDYFSRPENHSERDKLNALVGEYQDAFSDDGETLAIDDETASELIFDLQDALETFSPPYCYFGANEGDGSDFGWWPSWDSINELPQVTDNSSEAIQAEQSEDYSTDVRYVNDHGNVTVYGTDGSVLLELV